MANTIQSFFTYTSPLPQERISTINCLAFNESGTLLATGSYDIVKLFSIDGDSIIHITQWKPSINKILSVAFNPSGTILAVGSEVNIHLYNILYEKRSVTNLKIPNGVFSSVKSIAFDSTGKFLAFISKEDSITFWKITYDSSGTCTDILSIATFQTDGAYFSSLVFQPRTNPPLLVCSKFNSLEYFELSTKDFEEWEAKIIHSTIIFEHGNIINKIDFHKKINLPLLAAVTDNKLKLFYCNNPIDISEKASVPANENSTRCISVAFHPSELFLVTGYWDNTAKLWSISSDYRNLTCIANLSRGEERNSGVTPTEKKNETKIYKNKKLLILSK